MAQSERFDYNINIVVKGQGKVALLQKRLDTLGGKTAVKTQRAIQKLEREIKLLGPTAQKTSVIFSRFTKGIALGNIAANAFSKALQLVNKGFAEVGKAVLVAAQIEETGNVLEFVGNKAGYSAGELENYKAQLIKSGIAQKESNQAILRALQAHIELGDAVKLGRLAQDAAVIGLTNSSEAYTRIIESVAKLFPRLLKELGIIINLNNAYSLYAKEQGLVAARLTETQKKQAFLNAIFRKGKDIAGAYETAMENVSKRMRSLPRLFQDAQQAIGRHFVPAFGLGIAAAEGFLKSITALFGATKEEQTALDKMGTSFSRTAAKVERLNKAFVEGTLNLESYNEQIKQTMSDSATIIKDSQDEIIANILEHAVNTNDAMRMVQKAFEQGFLAAEKYVETQNKVLAELAKRRPVGEIYFAPLSREQQVARSRALTVFEIDAATYVETVEEVFKHLEAMAIQGITFATMEDAMKSLIDEMGFDSAVVEEAFGNSLQEGLDKAIDNLTPKAIVIPAPVFAVELREPIIGPDDKFEAAEHKRINAMLQAQVKEQVRIRDNNALKREQEQEYLAGIQELRDFGNQLQLERMTDLDATVWDIQLQAQERGRLIMADDRLTAQEQADFLVDISRSKEKQLADVMRDAGRELQAEWLQRWEFMRQAVTDSFDALAHSLMTTTKNMGEQMKRAFAQIGRDIVHNLIDVAVNAMFQWLAAQATQNKAQQEAIALTKTETRANIALAAAKSAVNPFSAPGRVAAATLTEGALTGLLGFDNPINDRFAFQNGLDFGEHFMSGLSRTLAAPDFGRTISIAVDAAIQPEPASRGNLTIIFEGPVNNDYVNDVVIPEIERAARGGSADILVGEPTLTGELDVNF